MRAQGAPAGRSRALSSIFGAHGRHLPDAAPASYRHELLQAFSFHLFAKRPVESVLSRADFRESVMRRLVLGAHEARCNVGAWQEPLFQFVEFNQLDSPRSGRKRSRWRCARSAASASSG